MGSGGASGATGGSTTSVEANPFVGVMPHRNPKAGGAARAEASATALVRGVVRGAAGRAPEVFTRTDWPSSLTSTDPSVSVR